MRIPSASTDRKIYFVAVDATDLTTRETGLTTFTVYRSRNGAAEVAYTTPTITEIDATNMPGVYALTVDEDTTLDSGHDTEEYCVHITHTGMAPVTRTVELYRAKFTEGQSATMANSAANANVTHWLGTAAATPTVAGVPEVDLTHYLGSATPALVGGRFDASVGAMAANVLTAAATAADFTTEIQTGLATAAELAKVPKSDGTVTWNALAADQIQQQCIGALTAYDAATGADLPANFSTLTIANNAVNASTVRWGGQLITEVMLSGTGNILPLVSADAISRDETAATNLEAMLDGTGATLTANITGNLSGSIGTNNDKTGYTLTAAYDLPFAHFNLAIDQANSKDEWSVSFSLNGVYQSATSAATIRVVKRTDGSDLIAQTAMTQVSGGLWKYDATTTARITAGEAVFVFFRFTVGVTTYDVQPLPSARDSEAP